MANSNFVVQNGITVGTTNIWAANGAITSTSTAPTNLSADINVTAGNITASTDNTAASFVASGSSSTNPQGGTNPLTDAEFVASKSVDSFVQVAVHNPSQTANASADFIAYSDIGDNFTGYIDMGIESTKYNNASFGLTKAGDGYIFMSAPTYAGNSVQVGGNLVLATDANNGFGDIVFSASGFDDANAVVQGRFVNGNGLVVTGNVISSYGAMYQGVDAFRFGQNYTNTTTLNGSATANVTTFIAASTTNFYPSGVITIDSEQVKYTSTNATAFLGLTRGFNSTTPASHSNGATIIQPVAGYTNETAVFTGNANAFVQVALRNGNNGSSASTDMIVYAANGDNNNGWMDMGITSGGYNDATYGVTGPDDGYLFMSAPAGATGNGSMFISTSNNGGQNDIVFSTNGFTYGTERMRIVGVGRAGRPAGVEVNIATTSTSTTTGALRVNGGIGLVGNLTVGGNVSIVGNISFGGAGTTVSSQSLTVENPISFLGNSNPGNSYDTGTVGIYKAGATTTYTGFVKQASTGYWRLFDNLTTLPTTTVSWASTVPAGMYVGNVSVGNTTASTATTNGALVVAGGAGIGGATYIGGNGTNAIVHTGHIIPSANLSYNLGSSTAWYSTFYGKATQAQYADLAENYQADANYPYGTVLMFGGAQEVTIATAETTAVAGVVSQNPAHLMNGALNGNNVVPLALTGRVPCNVIGPVKKGDLMVSAGFGFAKANNSAGVGQVIGKALSDFPATSKGQIEVVVGRF